MGIDKDVFTGLYCGGDPFNKAYQNGRIPLNVMQPVTSLEYMRNSDGSWQSRAYLFAPAAYTFEAMRAHAERDGVTLMFSGGYRTYDTQVALRESWCSKGLCSYAATPGTSNHGYGTAVDLVLAGSYNGITVLGDPKAWMDKTARYYGWGWPTWAPRPGVYEPWHWQAFQNVQWFADWIMGQQEPLSDGLLKEGERDPNPGGAIWRLQTGLNVWLDMRSNPPVYVPTPLVADGIFGPRTKEVVTVFQTVNGIVPPQKELVGVAGPTTRDTLAKLTGVPQ